jgi:MATE family multidrug resistance protein
MSVLEVPPASDPRAGEATPPIGPAAAIASRRPGLGHELRTLVALAGPVVLAEIGWMSMGIVDTLMVGPLGPQAIGAVGLGSGLFLAIGIAGMGVLFGLDTLVSQAFGARRLDECHRWLFHGVALAALLAPPLMLLIWAASRALPSFGVHPQVQPLAISYLTLLDLGLLPLLLYAAFRRYLQGMSTVHPVMFALISANIVNAFFNWVLIYGKLGMPAMGTDGSALATTAARVYMAAVLGIAIVWTDHRRRSGLWQVSRRIEPARLRQLFALGAPAAWTVTLEVGVFSAATAFAGKLEPRALAAHQIALNLAALTFMVPLGFQSSGAVLVGQAIGRRDPRGASRAGWLALAVIAACMVLTGSIFFAIPARLIGLFTEDAQVIAIGVSLLFVAALFQLFDGVQSVATGILRGVGNTRTPMWSNFVGHWLFGLPVGWSLCFLAGWGVVGLWTGLSVGLTLVAITLVGVWMKTTRRLRADLPFEQLG